MKKIDLLVIGAGPAGGRVATKCAQAGWNVAIAEAREFGGTCALRGCNPKKVLVHAAEVVDAARRSDGKLCDAGDIKIKWNELIQFKNSFVKGIPENSRQKFEDKGIKTYLGSPRFISESQLMIGDETIEPTHVLIATGAKPRPLDIPGEEYVTTSDAFMNLDELPKRIVFIGGGYISFEFAHVAVRAGSDVSILERADRPLKGFEESIVDQLVSKSENLGMQLRFNSKVFSVQKNEGDTYVVSFEQDGESVSIEADLVVHGAGRVPNLDGLDLEKGNVAFDKERGIRVTKTLRSKTNSIVMAAGDCADTGVASLTPTANAEGYTAVQNLLSEDDSEVSYGPVPAVAFTIPAIASVGLTESQANEQNKLFRVNEADASGWGSVKKVCESTAYYKVLVDEESDQIIGAHLIGPTAAETINLFAMAIKTRLTSTDLQSLTLAFPTSGYNIREMV